MPRAASAITITHQAAFSFTHHNSLLGSLSFVRRPKSTVALRELSSESFLGKYNTGKKRKNNSMVRISESDYLLFRTIEFFFDYVFVYVNFSD